MTPSAATESALSTAKERVYAVRPVDFFRQLNTLRRAFWRGARQHGVFMNAKGAAYSSILTIFPALLIVAWVLVEMGVMKYFLDQIVLTLRTVMPPGTARTALSYFLAKQQRPTKEIISASFAMLFAATGVMISWMTGFRAAYGMTSNPWSFWRERGVSILLVVLGALPMGFAMLLIAFGNQIEAYMALHFTIAKFYLLILWTMVRWIIAFLTSVTSIMLIYHFGLPRIQPWYRVLPGAIAATMMWFPLTLVFGWYVTRYAAYNLIYGPLGTGIALLVWLYLVSICILTGAEYNALVYPRLVPRAAEDERRTGDRRVADRRRAAERV
jgi:membrane protein